MTEPHDDLPKVEHLQGTLGLTAGITFVRMEAQLVAEAAVVWRALTEAQRLDQWLGRFDGELRSAGQFRSSWHATGWEGDGTVEVCRPLRCIELSMSESGSPEAHSVKVSLRSKGAYTALVVEEHGMPKDQLAAYGAGWQIHVEDLAAYLQGDPRCDATARWRTLHDVYVRKPIELVP